MHIKRVIGYLSNQVTLSLLIKPDRIGQFDRKTGEPDPLPIRCGCCTEYVLELVETVQNRSRIRNDPSLKKRKHKKIDLRLYDTRSIL
ncbi:hypothetical protein Lal_00017050 [Lupinus albus]|nr:hypothetical protein Lal_00017050 [Lupinus albus]